MDTRAFTAELSDPYAKPGMQHIGSVDAGEAALCIADHHSTIREAKCALLGDYHGMSESSIPTNFLLLGGAMQTALHRLLVPC